MRAASDLTWDDAGGGIAILPSIDAPKEPLPMIESEHDNLTPQKGRACPARTRASLRKGGRRRQNGGKR
jgi:hypothetical protein